MLTICPERLHCASLFPHFTMQPYYKFESLPFVLQFYTDNDNTFLRRGLGAKFAKEIGQAFTAVAQYIAKTKSF